MEALGGAEREVAQSGRLAAIGELAAGVAHEINNPLFAILALSEFLVNELEPGSKQHERAQLIHSTAGEIKEVVRALLDFAQTPSEEHALVSLADAVGETVNLLRRTNPNKGIEIVEEYPPAPLFVEASAGQLKHLVLSLLANARQALPDGGRIDVRVWRDGNEAILAVADDGPGVEPSLRERIFEPFFTTRGRSGGAGLGLSVALGIARAHGGSLILEPGDAGATFALRMPAA